MTIYRGDVHGRSPLGRRLARVLLFALVAISASLAPTIDPLAADDTSMSGTGGTQTNIYDVPEGDTSGDPPPGPIAREGCVAYSSTTFAVAFTSGSVDSTSGSGGTVNATLDNPIVGTVTFSSDDYYEGPNGTYNQAVTGEVELGSNPITDRGGCLRSSAGDNPVSGSVGLTLTKAGTVICTNSTSPASGGTIRRGDAVADPPGLALGDRTYTVGGVKCGTHNPYVLVLELTGTCAAPIAPATCTLNSYTLS